MVAASKHEYATAFSELLKTASTRELMHPWTSSHSLAVLDFLGRSLRGLYKHMIIVHLLQLAVKGRRAADPELCWRHLRGALLSTAIGVGAMSLWFYVSLIIRMLLGRYYRHTIFFLPCFIATYIATFFEQPSKLRLYNHTVCQVLLEYIARVLEDAGYRIMTPMGETIIFMLSNGILMYLLKSSGSEKISCYWFYKPPPAETQPKESNKTFDKEEDASKGNSQRFCPHKEICSKHIMKSVLQYAAAGIAIQVLVMLLTKFNRVTRSPATTLLDIVFNRNILKLGAFLGAYIGVFKTISCWLCRRRDGNADFHALVAGVAAGASYYIYPERKIGTTAVVSTLQLMIAYATSKRILPQLPQRSSALLTCLCASVLIDARFYDAERCPKLFTTMVGTITGGRSDYMYKLWMEHAEKIIKRAAI